MSHIHDLPTLPPPTRRGSGRKLSWRSIASLLLCGGLMVGVFSAQAQESVAVTSTTDRLVVRFKATRSGHVSALNASGQRVRQDAVSDDSLRRSMAARTGLGLSVVREMSDGAVIYQADRSLTLSEARTAAARMALDGDVLDAAPDFRVQAHGSEVFNDPQLSAQWAIRPTTTAAGGADFQSAWLSGTGQGVVVAVVDTGWRNHVDAATSVLAGRDFVSDSTIAGDGDGRDGDPTDPGDACAAKGTTSSWHGLMVSGVIGATANNSLGISGMTPGVSLLPVRAMGRCGGYLSDVADAIVWAVGASSPTNAHPAQVINLSLGGDAGASCPSYMQDAVTAAVQRGAVVVASAGNGSSTALVTPANCSGVIAVGAHTQSGDLASYSNRHGTLALTAPGGGACALMGTCSSTSILTLGDGNGYVPFAGTSAAAPHVSAAAALLLSLRPTLTPSQIKSLLQAQSTAHPAGSWCAANPGLCGSGMLNVSAAVSALAQDPTVSIGGVPSASISGGTAVQLAASVSGVAPYTYRWTQTGGTAVALSGSDSGTLSFSAPAKRTTLMFQLQATGANGRTGTAIVTVDVNNAPALNDVTTAQAGQAAYTLALPETDADGEAVSYVLISGPSGATLNGAQLFWPAPELGTSVFQLQGFDPEGLGSRVATVTLKVQAAGTVLETGSGTSSSSGSSGSTVSSTGSSGASGASSGGGGAFDLWPLLGLLVAIMAFKGLQRRPRRVWGLRPSMPEDAQRNRSNSLREARSSEPRSGTL